MRSLLTLLIFTSSFIQTACSQKEDVSSPEDKQETHRFMDDFDFFDEKVWTKETHEPGWVNQELQAYRPANVAVGTDNGKSVLILTAERNGDKIYSGRVNSQGKFNFKYGQIEASIKLPKTANGLWPAFWMMGDNGKNWPACGEIDILEMGERNGILNGTTETYYNTAIHYGPDMASHRQEYHGANFSHSLQDGEYHTYTLDWTEDKLTISIDGIEFKTFDIGSKSERQEYFRDPGFILFNLAVGGAFPDIHDLNELTALKDGEKAYMYIDWVKVY
ncbi:glycoside hydrolase family 16 protein [Marinilabilia sp.]|uniref:glycoside hydrolase family 16 protein n=1 Tax=Marinilabilia sp. TaxID=2021252 RepID=UPI0025BC482F|nr:glycoside hydrolase family 16 protein [Marinilabilia sp.]